MIKSIPARLPAYKEEIYKSTIAAKRRYIRARSRAVGPMVAAEKANVGYRTIKRWRRTDPEFVRQEALSQEKYLEMLEVEADRRGVDGVDEPIMHDGEVVHHKKKYSDQLLMFRLKKLDSEYRDSRGAEGQSGPTTVNIYLPSNNRPDEKVMIDVTPSTVKLEDKS